MDKSSFTFYILKYSAFENYIPANRVLIKLIKFETYVTFYSYL